MIRKILLNEEDQIMIEREEHIDGDQKLTVDLNLAINKIKMNHLVCVPAKTSIKAVMNIFKEKKVNAVLVNFEDSNDLGIFTERDFIQKILFTDLKLHKSQVKDFVTPSPQSLEADNPLYCALHIFAHSDFKHIPISIDGVFKFMLTPCDIVNSFAQSSNKSILNLPPEPLKETREIEGG